MNDFFITLLLMGALSSGDSLPFWMYSNQFGLMPESSGALAVARMGTEYDPSHALQWRWGASLAANYGSPVILSEAKDLGKERFSPMLDELYTSLKWKSLSLDLGMKRFGLDYYGAGSESLGSLSSTGGHIIWSGNARSMPGYTLNLAPVPVPFTGERVKFFASYGDYRTLDNRFMDGTLVHRTSLGLDIKITERLDFHGVLDHFALWGGKSDKLEMPVTLGNYFRVVMASEASENGTRSDQINVIGDQRGSELFRLNWRGNGWKISAQHDIPYDDGSGMGFQNFPDGVNTLWFGFDDKDRWISDLLYEYHYTMYQSGTRHDRPTTDEEKQHLDPSDEYHYNRHIIGGGDNYFNNGEYRSGWTYYGRTIGNPLIVPKGTHTGTWTGREVVLGVENNRLKAHHFAIAGKLFRKAPYKLMLTYSQNYGTYSRPYTGESQWGKDWGTVKETPLHQVYAAFMGEIPGLLRHFTITYGLFADKGDLIPDNFGASIGLRYDLRRK
ncbi:MAG: hypothetical protein IJK70_05375 [Bacteroidales bacterium]|nr:hypothetical protein [Bacteroidales bacterium]